MKGINPDTGKPTQRYDFAHSRKHRKLQNSADRLLAKAGFFIRKDDDSGKLPADCVGSHGRLRPTWIGRP